MKSKFFFLTATLVLTLQNLQANTLVISDIDDTIKITDVLGKKGVLVKNALLKKTAFAGMSELYNELNKKDETTIYYLSGSPKIIKSRVCEFLEHNNFPQSRNVILKEKVKLDTIEYKTTAIRELIKKINPDTLIMIGDDGEFDPKIYKIISDENPEITSAIYIRNIAERVGVDKHFFSSVEIAGFEILAGRLEASSLSSVTEGFVNQSNKSAISIKERFCPVAGSEGLAELLSLASDKETTALLENAQLKVQSSCK